VVVVVKNPLKCAGYRSLTLRSRNRAYDVLIPGDKSAKIRYTSWQFKIKNPDSESLSETDRNEANSVFQ
jgi:hypothetical protein